MQKHRFLLSLLCLVLTITGTAQPYILRHLGIENGLSNNYVQDIVQDKRGCIWIATESGLNRFDGCSFTNYKNNNLKLIDNALNALLYDEEENLLWIAGKTDGINILDCSTFQIQEFQPSKDIPISNIVHFSHAADGGLWLTPYHADVIHYNKKKKIFTSLSDIKGLDSPNWCTFDNGKGHLYIGHAQGGMSIVDLEKRTAYTLCNDPNNPLSLPGNNVYVIYKDHSENIWVGTNQGLALFNPQTEEFTVFRHDPDNRHSLVADHIYDIKEMNDGTLWIASDIGGISILDLHSITLKDARNIQFYNIIADNTKNGVSSGNIRKLLQDSFGNIWIGNYSSGIDFISHSQPVFHVLPYMIEKGSIWKNKSVWGIYKDNKEQVWVGGENEIALFKGNKLMKKYDITKQLSRPYGQVFSIIGDEQGTLLLGIYDDGLLKFDTHTERFERIPMDTKNVDIITFYKDWDESIWIGTEYGIYTYRNGILNKEEALNSQLKERQSVYGILRDKQGKLWIGTYGEGLIVFDQYNKKIVGLGIEHGFLSNAINDLYLDKKGGIWIATRKGLAYIKDTNYPEKFQFYEYRHGLKDTFVRSVGEDNSGNIWISTNGEISCLNRQEQKFECYDYRDGIPMGNFIEGSVCSTEDGTLYFGSLNGVCYFNTKSFLKKQQVVPIQIIECKRLGNQMINSNEDTSIPISNGCVELPYNKNSFRIVFSVPDYSQSSLVEYAYTVTGMGENWTNTLDENQVTLHNIAPGEYMFKVKARLRNQEWNDSSTTILKVRIYPPIWLTWYAKIFYALLILLSIYLWFCFYKRRLLLENSLELERKKNLNDQELNNERLRFYTNITHELRTPLTLILGPLEDLVNDSKLPAPYGSKIKLIHDSAMRLLNLINRILEFRKTETQNRKLSVARGNLSELVQEIGLRYKELNRNEKVKINIIVDINNDTIYFDEDIISTVLNNLLSNAMKYTPVGEIKLIMRTVFDKNNRYTEIIVSDTGYGIEADALPYIFDRYYQADSKYQASGTGIGLALVKSLADLHEAELSVESEVGKGTTFCFRLLTENTYPSALHKEGHKHPVQKNIENMEEEDRQNNHPIILVIEDNDDIRDYIANSFSGNYRIQTAVNGKEGLELALNEIPDIIISDIMMPIMDGIELCKRVKEDIRTSHIPVILLTAKDSLRDKEEGYESGADSYLTKPFSARLLNSRIHNLLESRQKIAQLIINRTKDTNAKEETGQGYPEVQESVRLSILDQEFINKFTRIVEENIDIPELDMAYMQDKMHMSYSTLYRKIKGLTGMSCNEFIRNIKLKNCLRLLLKEGCSIAEAAYSSGFNDLGYFRSCFKEKYGMLPSEYLKQKRL